MTIQSVGFSIAFTFEMALISLAWYSARQQKWSEVVAFGLAAIVLAIGAAALRVAHEIEDGKK